MRRERASPVPWRHREVLFFGGWWNLQPCRGEPLRLLQSLTVDLGVHHQVAMPAVFVGRGVELVSVNVPSNAVRVHGMPAGKWDRWPHFRRRGVIHIGR
ncbi:hypothetical protein D3C72_2046370 [compost metagenome]